MDDTILDHDTDGGSAPARRMTPAGRAVKTMLAALLIAAFLNAEALARVADQQPDGWQRTVAVALTTPIDEVADVLGLDEPRESLDALTGAELQTADEFGGGLEHTPATLDRAPPPVTATSTSTTIAPTTTTTLAPRRTPTPAAPLRVLFAGDSLIGNVADGFARLSVRDGRLAPSRDVQVATGLARPDVLDWPTHLDKLLRERKPEVVYVMFGGNDDQPLRAGDRRFPLFSKEWADEYRRRVSLMMDIAGQGDRTVVWIAMPTVEPGRLQQASRTMNAVARAEADRRPRVVYFDPDPVVAPGGKYTRVVRTAGGEVEVRTEDGVHISHRGSDLLAPHLLNAVAKEWHLADPPGGA